jgi:dephospho-CoA kinase
MYVIVLTGGLGSGKSTAAAFFHARGAVTCDLDRVAACVLAPGSETLAAVAREFGTQVLCPDGSLDRAALAEAAFGSLDETRKLNAITHDAIAQATRGELERLRTRPDPPDVAVVEIPLLAEAPEFARLGDVVLALEAPADVRADRATERGLTEDDAWRRIKAQASDAERATLADVVIANDGPRARLVDELERFWCERVEPGLAKEASRPT